MTAFMSGSHVSLWLREKGIDWVLQKLLARLQFDFGRWGDFHKSSRLAHHGKNGVLELMPIGDSQYFSFKYVNGHPANTQKGLLTVAAFGLLADVETGYPLLLSDLTLLTALRTAATSVMVAKEMAKPEASSMSVIGCGSQSEFQILAFHLLMGIKEVNIYDIDPQACKKLIQNLTDYPDLNIHWMSSVQEAVKGTDIVTTITADKTKAVILTPEMIEEGMHINAVGGDCPGKTELHPDIVYRSQVCVEFEPQSRAEGELQQMPKDFPVVEFWRILEDKRLGRKSPEDVTIFDSVGFALEDFSALMVLWQSLQDDGVANKIDLLPNLDDPKNLYGYAMSVVSVPVFEPAQALSKLFQESFLKEKQVIKR
jgi:ornithine cyclodeaminase